jgi:transposase
VDIPSPYVVVATASAARSSAEKVPVDPFHIMQHVLAAVDEVLRQKNEALRTDGDERLSGSKHKWLRRATGPNGTARTRPRLLRATGLKMAPAGRMKAALRGWLDFRRRGGAERFCTRRMYFCTTPRRSAPMDEAAKSMRRYLPTVLTCLARRITSAVAEAIKAKIATVGRRAYRFVNLDHFKIAIYCHCGLLHLLATRATPTRAGQQE